jgi:hypothetical protein
MELSVNGYSEKVMVSILKNPQEPKASLAGIVNAANQEPGSLAGTMQIAQELSYRQGPPTWTKEIEETQAAGLTRGSVWEEMRDNLNQPGAMSENTEKVQEAMAVVEQSRERLIDLNEQEIHANDTARQQDRQALLSEFARARAASGKSQVAQQVRNAYTNLTGASIAGVRQAFNAFAG